MKITMLLENKEYSITLNNTLAAKDFYNLLPLTLSLKDFNNKEKIGFLDKKLNTTNPINSGKGFPGDITYYIPWGNIAIFYEEFNLGSDLIKLGKIDEGASMLINQIDNFEVKFIK